MKKAFKLVLGLLTFTSCTGQLAKEDQVLWVESDWVFVRDTLRLQFDPSYIGLRFLGDTMTTLSNWGLTNEGKYLVDGDRLQVFGYSDTTIFTIARMTEDSLQLYVNGDTLNHYKRKLEYDSTLIFSQIVLEAERCFGDCPEFEMTLYQNGGVEFEGMENSKVLGKLEYTIEAKRKSKIDSLFRWSNIANLDTAEFYGVVDDWSMDLTFYYDADEVKKVSGTQSVMPFRLKGIIQILLDDLKERGLI